MTNTVDPYGQERQDTELLHEILGRDTGTIANIVQSASEQQGSLSERFRKALAEFPEAQAEPATSDESKRRYTALVTREDDQW